MKQVTPGTRPHNGEQLLPGSLVFVPPSETGPLDNIAQWWKRVPGTNWRHPEATDSEIEERADHPVEQFRGTRLFGQGSEVK